MTKYKTHKFGKMTFKPYFKTVGNGWEVGMTYLGKPFFVGNFIHAGEAKKWWRMMNTYCVQFYKKHEYVPTASDVWYCKYFGNYLYKNYYQYLDKEFAKYQKSYSKKNVQYFKNYKKFENKFYAA